MTVTLIDKVEDAIVSIQTKLKQPYFRSGDILEIDSEMSILNRVLADQDKKFPFVYMRSDYIQKTIIKNKEYETDLTLFLVDRTSKDNYTDELRRENEWPDLIESTNDILRALELAGMTVENEETQIKNYNSDENELNTPVNIVRIQVNESQYQLLQC